jgi:hypothetical protein
MPAEALRTRAGGDVSFDVRASPFLGAGLGEGDRILFVFAAGGLEGDFRASFHCCTR